MWCLNRKISIDIYLLIIPAVFLFMSTCVYADQDYYNYWSWSTGYSSAYGVDGWVGNDGINRVIFYSGQAAFIYQVTTTPGPNGDNPNLHPDNPDATGAIAPRVFTYESMFTLHSTNYGHECEFHVGSDGFYLGAKNGIEKYAFDGTYLGNLGAPTPPTESGYSTQSLAYDALNNDWWAGSIGFDGQVEMYCYDADSIGSSWQLKFVYVTPGNHHDGLEMLPNGNLLTADYTGQILEYMQDGTLVATYNHTPFPTELEGMGAGALGHYWGGSHGGVIFEFGGGILPPPNNPPDCDEAFASQNCIWPPNHKFVKIDILGVTDPDGDPVTITITSITSDEPTATDEGSGGEEHSPDATGIGKSSAQVRAERSGDGNGRVYEINFIATDGKGGESEGSVLINVPHDQKGKDCTCVDDGQIYDATEIN